MDNITKDIVLSSRIRLARNFDNVNFPLRLNSIGDAKFIVNSVFESINNIENFSLFILKNMDKNTQIKYLEKHLISKELIENSDISAFCVNQKEDVIVMINEEDHIREQCIKNGFSLDEAFEKLNNIDNQILKNCDIAYSDEYGFLTACPTNIGTGLRASCMMFLPALTMSNAIKGIIETFSKLGFAVRGVFGEGSGADGYLYQISNQTTLGQSENEIIQNVKNAVVKVCEMENQARDVLFNSKKDDIKDSTYRAYGILSNSYIMTSSEFTKLLSQLRLGKALDLIEFKNPNILDEIEISCQPANLVDRYGDELSQEKRDKFRADYLSRALNNQRL